MRIPSFDARLEALRGLRALHHALGAGRRSRALAQLLLRADAACGSSLEREIHGKSMGKYGKSMGRLGKIQQKYAKMEILMENHT